MVRALRMIVAVWGSTSILVILLALKDASFVAPSIFDFAKAAFFFSGPAVATIWFAIDDLRRDP